MQFQSEIELRVKVLDKELDDLEKRMQRVANPFQASGARKVGFQSKAELAAQKTLLSTDRNRLELAQQLNVQRIKSLNLNNSWYKALQQGKQIQLDINNAVAKEAKQRQRVTDTLKRQQATQKKNRRQDILLGAGFPLLFGGGIGQAVAGGLGGAVGGFGGGIAAQAALRAVTDLNNAITETAAVTSSTSAAYDFLTEKQLFSSEETRRLADELAELGRVEELAALTTRELVNMIGNEGVNNLQALDSEWNELLSNVAELGLAIAAFISQYLEPVIALLNNAVGSINTRNRFESLRGDLQGTDAGKQLEEAIREIRKERGRGARLGAVQESDMERLIKQFQPQRAITAKVPVTDADRKRFAPPKAKAAAGGKSDEDRIRERIELLRIETAAIQQKAAIDQQISQARIAEDQSLENKLRLSSQLIGIQEGLAKALVRETDERIKQELIVKAQAQAEAAKAAAANREAERIAKANQSYNLQIETLGLQLQAVEAITREEEKQAELQLRLLRLREANKDLAPEQLAALEEATRKLFEATNLGPLDAYIKNTSKALADTEMQMVRIVQTVEGQLASGITNFFTGIIDGSKSAEEAFADMLKGMGQALIQTAAQMIAQYIAIGIARAFAGMGGGGFGSGASAPISNIPFSAGGIGYRANGGPVDSATPYIVGERGPELFIPNQSGSIMTNGQSKAALNQFSPGNSSSPAVFTGADGEAMPSAGDRSVPMNFNYSTIRIADEEYISKAQLEESMTAAAKEGAMQGEARALRKLQMSPSARRKVGL